MTGARNEQNPNLGQTESHGLSHGARPKPGIRHAPGQKPDPAALARAKTRRDTAAAALTTALQKVPTGGPLVIQTRHGRVDISSVTPRESADGTTWIEIHLDGIPQGGDPHYRIFNPPLLAPDPAGPIQPAGPEGPRWREDPITAVAEAIAANGGATKTRRRR